MQELPDDDDWLTDRYRIIGQRIREERLRQNATQDRVWQAARIDRRTLQHAEGGAETKLGTLLRIAHVLNIDPAELVSGTAPADAGGDADRGPDPAHSP